jgi:acetyltransferase-like isoleucine patch superfamily enzyme
MSNHTFAESLGTSLQAVRESASLLWCLEAKLKGARVDSSVQMIGRPLLSVAKGSRLVLESGVRINSSLRSNPLGCFQPSVLRTLAPNAQLVLGKNVGISGTVICAGLSVEIGEGTIIGSGAMIIDNDFHSPLGEWDWQSEFQKNARPIRIGRGAFLGARVIILKGVTIGDRAVIGAGAVVAKDVPPGCVAFGNPAKIGSAKEGSPNGPPVSGK